MLKTTTTTHTSNICYIFRFLIPGGSASLTDSGYSRAAKKIFDIVKRNDNEDQIPLWATCLGFEIVMLFEGGHFRNQTLTRCNASNVADPLYFEPGTIL